MNEILREQLLTILESGNERAVKDFLIEHLKEFSEEIQENIVTLFFTEALEQYVSNGQQIISLQKELLATLEKAEKTEAALNDKKKELDAKEQLGL